MAQVQKEVDAILEPKKDAEPLIKATGYSTNDSVDEEDRVDQKPMRSDGDGEYDETRG